MTSPFKKLETPLSDSTCVCRGCLLDTGEMKNMFEWGLIEDFYKFTDVQITQTDLLSELLCVNCEDILTKCKDFRTQCQNSDSLLRNMVQEKLKLQDASTHRADQAKRANNVTFLLYDEKLVFMVLAPDTADKVYLPCPYECTREFIKKKDLLIHLSQTHKINEVNFTIDIQYFCFHENCSYNISSGKNIYFKERKFLNQHYLKVHKEKDFCCNECKLSFSTEKEYNRHLPNCNDSFVCQTCLREYKTHERFLVHMMRKHPELHKQYKNERKLNKRKSKVNIEAKKVKTESDKLADYMCDSPKRSFATQTLNPEDNIKNDVALPSWSSNNKNDETKKDEISTQTVFEDLLSLKSQTSEDDSLFFSETVSLSDIQTQTFPVEFGLSRCNKETITSETQSPDLSIKETQTCVCLYDSPKPSFRLFDSISSSPCSLNLTSTETQTAEDILKNKSDYSFGLNTAETQTSFEDDLNKDVM